MLNHHIFKTIYSVPGCKDLRETAVFAGLTIYRRGTFPQLGKELNQNPDCPPNSVVS